MVVVIQVEGAGTTPPFPPRGEAGCALYRRSSLVIQAERKLLRRFPPTEGAESAPLGGVHRLDKSLTHFRGSEPAQPEPTAARGLCNPPGPVDSCTRTACAVRAPCGRKKFFHPYQNSSIYLKRWKNSSAPLFTVEKILPNGANMLPLGRQ